MYSVRKFDIEKEVDGSAIIGAKKYRKIVYVKIKEEKKMTKKLLACFVAAFLVVMMASAPAFAAPNDEDIRIVFVPNGVADFWTIVAGGFMHAAQEAGIRADIMWPDQEEAGRQVETMYDAINSRPNAIVNSPMAADAMVPVYQAAKDAGIPVISVDNIISTSDYVAAFKTDNREAGAAAAEQLAQLMGGKGKVQMFVGSLSSSSNSDRVSGFSRHMRFTYPEIEVLGVLFSASDGALAASQTVDIITANPDLNGIFAVDETRTSGCGSGLISINREDVALVGFDANRDTVALMETGVVNALVVQQPFQMGYMAFQAALKAVRGEDVPHGVVDTGCTVVTPENMNDEEMQKLLFPLDHIS